MYPAAGNVAHSAQLTTDPEAIASVSGSWAVTSTPQGSGGDLEAEIEGRFFKDGRHVDTCEGGDITMTFDLDDGRQWKKRVWPRREYPKELLHWNSVEEILSYLISFGRHEDWMTSEVPQRPPSGSILFFNRSQTKKYRSDGYSWKTRRTMINIVREDRMKLKVGGYQLVYGCYAHSASDPNFHRRTYWLIQNPDLVMVHYLDSQQFLRSRLVQSSTHLEPHMMPTSWSMLTISDNNLCTLLNMTTNADTTKTLLSQLTEALNASFGTSPSSLREVLISNNVQFPVDMFAEYSRTKRPKLKAETASFNESPRTTEDCLAGMLMETSRSTAHSNVPPTTPTITNNSVEVMSVLSKAPHIIMCCPTNGSVSYILTVPKTESPRKLSPLPARQTGPLNSMPAGTPGGRGHADSAGTAGNGRRNRKISQKGKEKAVEGNVLNSIQKAISGLIIPGAAVGQSSIGQSSMGPSSIGQSSMGQSSSPMLGQEDHRGSFMDATPTPTTDHSTPSDTSPSVASHDYDPEKFSKFANFLVKMDPIESIQSLTPDEDSRSSRSGSFRSSESDPPTTTITGTTADSGGSIQHGIGSALSVPYGPKVQDQMSSHMTSSQDNCTNLTIPAAVPMSWVFPGQTGPLGGGEGEPSEICLASGDASGSTVHHADSAMDTSNVNFGLDLGSESWKQYLECSLGSSIGEHHQSQSDFSNINQLVDSLSSTDNTQLLSDAGPNADLVNAASESGMIRGNAQCMMGTTANSNSWNGTWQNCNPDSINNWLQSSFPLDDSGISAEPMQVNSNPPLTNPDPFHSHNPHHPHHHPPPLQLDPAAPSTDLPQDLRDFIFDTATNTTATSSSIGVPSPLSSHPHTPHDTSSHLTNFLVGSSSPSSSHYTNLPSLDLCDGGESDYLQPKVRTYPSRKISDVSVYSEPPLGAECLDQNASSHGFLVSSDQQFHLSLPDLSTAESAAFPSITIADTDGSFTGGGGGAADLSTSFQRPTLSNVPIPASSSPNIHSSSSVSPTLQNIPEGAQMTRYAIPSGFLGQVGHSPIPSSPSASSTVSTQELFDDSPSVKQLCEMLSESVSMHQTDMTLTDLEQDQLFHAAETIQIAFRKYKSRRQLKSREKSAALLIEKYYRQYKETKDQKDQAARRIQNQYRMYRRRTRELDELSRAATFIQQMYRFHRTRRPFAHPYQFQRHNSHSSD